MIEINLLPKEYLKRSSALSLGKTGVYAVAGVGVIAVVLSGLTFYQIGKIGDLEAGIEKANRRASVLKQDIAVVEALEDVKNKIATRMAAVERLDRHRSAYVKVLQDFAYNVPEFVWLAAYKEQVPEIFRDQNNNANSRGNSTKNATPASAAEITANVKKLEIEGYTFTLNALAAYMIKMMRSDYFEDVELVSSLEIDLFGEKAYNFILTANVHFLSDEELGGLANKNQKNKLASNKSTSHKRLN